ncbi:MAG: hypothetical protein HeimC3_38620 [Candidatus Heimdallarchaeota archaeon LC_3]|nr:MAG: hypothetical protein HeimC3_38620 [Candidatus Heimdallarchaeota archaeon LC_3]
MGLGKEFLNFLISSVFDRNNDKLILGVSFLNHRAIKFYSKCDLSFLDTSLWFHGPIIVPNSENLFNVRKATNLDIEEIMSLDFSSIYTQCSKKNISELIKKPELENLIVEDVNGQVLLFSEIRHLGSYIKLNTLMMKIGSQKVIISDLVKYLHKKYRKQIKFYLEGRWRNQIEDLMNIGFIIDYKESEILLVANRMFYP